MKTSTLPALAAAFVLAASAFAATPRRPNLLLVFTDDQRWDALGVVQKEQGEKGRFPWLKTPNLDRLANEGLRFRNAFVINLPASEKPRRITVGEPLPPPAELPAKGVVPR